MQNETVETLNGFLRGEISAVETYRQAIDRIRTSSTRAQLESCQRSHEQRVLQLRDQVRTLGGTPAEGSGAWGGFVRLVEGGAKLFGEKSAISALEEGEDHGLELYRKGLEKLDVDSRSFVERAVIPAQEQTHRTVSALKHTVH
jgi:rubrerythrin